MRFRFSIIILVAGMLWLPASVFSQDTIPSGVTIHVVQRGETLFRIALDNGWTVDQLTQLNNLSDPSNIYVGQRLLVPSGDAAQPPQKIMHVVQPGETLTSIAALYGASASDLITVNGLANADAIYIGQLLDVSSAPPQPDAPASEPVTEPAAVALAPSLPQVVIRHTVQSGDTMFRIAQQYGVSVNSIAQANNIDDPTLIYAEQELIIPGVEVPPVALDMPAAVLGIDVTPLLFVEGRAGRVILTTAGAASISGTFLGQVLSDGAESDATQHTLLVGVPLSTENAVHPLNLTITGADGTQMPLTINVRVISGAYYSEQIQLTAGSSNLLDQQVETAEFSLLANLTSSFTPTRFFDGPMGLPAAAPLSSSFGNRRSYNGGDFTRFHTGTDFAAAPGTPILAPAAGTVVFAGTLDVRGVATVIDHGWGVFTVYCHQSEQYARVGDHVAVGQVIGATGSTGRVTGAHLHWELWVNGVPVDPMQWVSDSFW